MNDIQCCACGNHSTVIILSSGRVMVFGETKGGLLGTGDTGLVTRLPPRELYFHNTIFKMVFDGKDSTFLIQDDGTLWITGEQSYSNSLFFKPVSNLSKIKYVSSGNSHILLLDENHCVWGQGQNLNGQLGFGDNLHRSSFEMNKSLPPILQAEAGYGFSLFLDHDGNVLRCGKDVKDNAIIFGRNNTPKIIPELSNIQQISAYDSYSVFLDINSKIWACGKNDNALPSHFMENLDCISDIFEDTHQIVKIKASDNRIVFLDIENRIWICKQRGKDLPYCKLLQGLPPIVHFSVGPNHSLYIDEDHRVWGQGDNDYYQLGKDPGTVIRSNAEKPKLLHVPTVFIPQRRSQKSARFVV